MNAGAEGSGRASDPRREGWVCESMAMRRIFGVVDRIADSDAPVLIRGESGVGKEIVAREIHARSRRAEGPLVKVNCAALPSELLESELFGHEKGAFTGAHADKPGKFELADGGTVFLDEVGEMQVAVQAKLLQVLQEGEFFRVGGRRPVRVEARVVGATNRDLERAIEEGSFREDLYYRLNVVSIRVPPLRERKEDIAPLVEHFATKYGLRYAGETTAIDEATMSRFLSHRWPGNVRELENMVRRIALLGEDAAVAEALAVRGGAGKAPADRVDARTFPDGGLKELSRRAALEAEREAIARALRSTGWNRRRAAALLQISYKAMLYKIRESGIRDPREVPSGGEG